MENFQQYRDGKAEELLDLPDKDERKEKLEEIIDEDLYKISKFIKRIKTELPEEFADAENLYTPNYESIESSKDWEVEDISAKIPQELKILTEYGFLRDYFNQIKSDYLSCKNNPPKTLEEELRDFERPISKATRDWAEVRIKKYTIEYQFAIDRYTLSFEKIKSIIEETSVLNAENNIKQKFEDSNAINQMERGYPLHKIIDSISGGEYLDLRNLNHIVSAQMKSSHARERFSVDSQIKIDRQYGDLFFMESGVNYYAYSLYKPLMIMTSFSEKARRFVKGESQFDIKVHDPWNYKIDEDGELISNNGGGSRGAHIFNQLFFLANYPFVTPEKESHGKPFVYSREAMKQNKYKWTDLFNTIIDFKVGKIFRKKISNQEKSLVKKDISKYRSLLREKFNIDSSVFDNGPIPTEKIFKRGGDLLKDIWERMSPNKRIEFYKTVGRINSDYLRYFYGEADHLKLVKEKDGLAHMHKKMYKRLCKYLEKHPKATAEKILVDLDSI